MTVRRVQAPDGVEWVVRRRWSPRRGRPGFLRRKPELPDAGGLGEVVDAAFDVGDVPIIGWFFIAAGVLAGVLLLIIVLPGIVLFGIQIVWLGLLGAIGLIGRLVFRRPWRIDAMGPLAVRSWHVRGFRAAGRRRDELADAFANGRYPSPDDRPPVPH